MNSFALADLTVHRIEEVVDPNCDPFTFLPDLTPEIMQKHLGWMSPRFYDAEKKMISITMQTWLIQSEHHNILVDTCNGNHKTRPYFQVVDQLNTPYLELLTAAGCPPEDVDYVLCTHMHVDHVGWNTRLQDGRWVPTFPNAKYLFSRAEYAQYQPENYINGAPPIFLDVFEDSVLPVIEAGLAQMVEGCFTVSESVTIDPAPGHTPGHFMVRAGRQGDMGLFVGDAIHNPIQIAEPQLSTSFCTDPKLAAKTRARILEECAEQGHLLVPTHFAPPHIGHVTRDQGGFHFIPGR